MPIGALGTVIGISQRRTQIDVVFDQTFMSGNSLRDRFVCEMSVLTCSCSPYRGMTVASYSLLNLTNQQLIASSVPKTSTPPKQPANQGLNVHAPPFNHKPAARGKPPYMDSASGTRSPRGRGGYNGNSYADTVGDGGYRGRGRGRGRGYPRGY